MEKYSMNFLHEETVLPHECMRKAVLPHEEPVLQHNQFICLTFLEPTGRSGPIIYSVNNSYNK